MAFNILWPAMRWPDNREIEISSVGDNSAQFSERYVDVSEEQWATCDAVVSVMDIPEEYRSQMKKCRIFVTPKVGFDNIDVIYALRSPLKHGLTGDLSLGQIQSLVSDQ